MLLYRNLILATQAISVAATLIILVSGMNMGLSEASVKEVGGSLSLGLIMGGVIAHIQAKRGVPNPGLLALLGCFGPVYAAIGGLPQYLFGFHVVALGFHGFVLKLLTVKHDEENATNKGDGPEN